MGRHNCGRRADKRHSNGQTPFTHCALQTALAGSGAELTQAVDNMLEVVPTGTHKWVGMDSLLQALQLEAEQVQ